MLQSATSVSYHNSFARQKAWQTDLSGCERAVVMSMVPQRPPSQTELLWLKFSVHHAACAAGLASLPVYQSEGLLTANMNLIAGKGHAHGPDEPGERTAGAICIKTIRRRIIVPSQSRKVRCKFLWKAVNGKIRPGVRSEGR